METGAITTWQLNDRIHKFHDGPSRQLFARYQDVDAGLLVAHGFVAGLLKEAEVPSSGSELNVASD